MEEMMETGVHFVLLRWTSRPGKSYEIIKDYDNSQYTWGSPVYEVVGYFNTRANARRARDIHKRLNH